MKLCTAFRQINILVNHYNLFLKKEYFSPSNVLDLVKTRMCHLGRTVAINFWIRTKSNWEADTLVLNWLKTVRKRNSLKIFFFWSHDNRLNFHPFLTRTSVTNQKKNFFSRISNRFTKGTHSSSFWPKFWQHQINFGFLNHHM